MLEATQKLLRERGYNGTGLNLVIKESGAPKGSLYHYFPDGKEQLASEAITMAARSVRDRLEAAFDHSQSVAEACELILLGTIKELEELDFQCGCPIATVALEVAATSDRVYHVCDQAFDGLLNLFETRLLAAGYPAERSSDIANLLLTSYEGAMLLSRGQRDTTPLRRLISMIPAILQD